MLSETHSVCVLLISFYWSSELFQGSSAELRFCIPQYGPQRMLDKDCPGGFVFNEPTTPSCKYYAKTGDGNGKFLTAPINLCATDNTETDRIIADTGDSLNDINMLTYFRWEETDTNETMNNTGQFTPEDICHEECLPEWEDPHTITDDDPIPDDFDASKLPADELKELKEMNKEMFRRLMMDEDDEEDQSKKIGLAATTSAPPPQNTTGAVGTGGGNNTLPTTTPSPQSKKTSHTTTKAAGSSLLDRSIHDSSILNVIKVLSKSMKILLGACAPFIPEDFAEQVLRGMIYISQKMEHTFLDIGSDLYQGIARTLDHCGLRRTQEFKLNGSFCGEKSTVVGIYFTKLREYRPHRLSGWSFRWGRWHPLLDAAWSFIDFVHNFCFESFMHDMMLLHVYEMSLEGLFPERIQNMWRVNMPVNNDKFWNNVLQTYDLNITMRNLDACQEGARMASPLKVLPRPFLTLTELAQQPPPPPTTPPAKGWNKTMAMYWNRYEKLGGFPKVSENFGKCFGDDAHLEEEEELIEGLKQKCST